MKWMLAIFISVFLLLPIGVYADSSYVLPYPSEMPGSRFYQAQLFIEKISEFWYFGSFGQFKYSLNNSDKYLVEAKTLLEYNQFLLAVSSLKISNDYFSNVPKYLKKARSEGKNISESLNIFNSAKKKHIEVLTKLKKEVPATLTWKPENNKPTFIKLHLEIDKAIEVRNDSL